MPADGPGCCVGTVVVSDAVQGSGSSELCNKRDIGSDVGCLSVGCRSFPSAEVSLGVKINLTFLPILKKKDRFVKCTRESGRISIA